MSPTIVLRDGRPVLTVGAAGGPKIITQVALTIIRHLHLGLPLEKAIAAPRFHHQWSPDRLYVETTVPNATVQKLKEKGHAITRIRFVGVTQGIARPTPAGDFFPVHDPRVPGSAKQIHLPSRN